MTLVEKGNNECIHVIQRFAKSSCRILIFVVKLLAESHGQAQNYHPSRQFTDNAGRRECRDELQSGLGLQDRKSFCARYLAPALLEGLIEMTIPDKSNSRLQKYRLTATGLAWVEMKGKAHQNYE